MGFQLQYPAGGPYTLEWVPSRDFVIRGSSENENEGIAAQVAADQTTQYAQEFGEGFFYTYTRLFSKLTATDKANWKTFRDTVKGEPFDFIDGECGPITSFKKVKLDPDNYHRDWEYQPNQKFGFLLIMVDSI